MEFRERADVLIPTSHGGHLELLLAIRDAFDGCSRVWLTPPSAQARALEREGERVRYVVNPWRRPTTVARNALQSARAVLGVRPRAVVSAGAGAAVPACALARALGARLVFIETTARVERGSASGRMLHPLTHTMLVQWPELQRAYGRAELCRPALFEAVGTPADGRRGTFVAAGTHGRPFTRLLGLVEAARAAGVLPEPVRVQAGEVLDPAELERAVRGSEVVICHGGSGLISLALRAGHAPLVLPRRAAHGEHFDDHQVGMVRRLAEHGLVVSLDERPIDAEAVAQARRPPPAPHFAGRDLEDAVRAALAA